MSNGTVNRTWGSNGFQSLLYISHPFGANKAEPRPSNTALKTPQSCADTIPGDTRRSKFGIDIKPVLPKAASNPQPTFVYWRFLAEAEK